MPEQTNRAEGLAQMTDFGVTAKWVVLGDPASLYVCRPEALSFAPPLLSLDGKAALGADGWYTVVTGSTAPRVPEVDLTIIELQAMIDAHARAMNDAPPPFTYHYHGQAWWTLRKLRDRRLALETTRDMLR